MVAKIDATDGQRGELGSIECVIQVFVPKLGRQILNAEQGLPNEIATCDAASIRLEEDNISAATICERHIFDMNVFNP